MRIHNKEYPIVCEEVEFTLTENARKFGRHYIKALFAWIHQLSDGKVELVEIGDVPWFECWAQTEEDLIRLKEQLFSM